MFLIALYVECFTRVRSFIKDKEAASGIEYALLAAMVAVALVAFVPGISGRITTMFTNIQGAL
ncbi:pilus assembly protein [Pseudomonas floridensis]|uniref:Pilus assembly protein n=1 Tax=Pseudomonas floridensis TaxID=1958950 RepID=A0A1X0N5M2_9PSED|nr:Flp family type IVb pilin [Pseudomonas floridensis]ORC58214.1 pilus assembly protein [Pseudomonas floridensis]